MVGDPRSEDFTRARGTSRATPNRPSRPDSARSLAALRQALVVVGKAPRAGATKTRLSPALSPADAARLYAAFLRDTIAMAAGLGWERVSLVYPPEEGAAE